MKLWCKVNTVNYSILCPSGIPSCKPRDGCLIIGNSNDKILIKINFKSFSPSGNYVLSGNISNIFCRHTSEGKLTIRLKEPTIDIMISKADVVTLRSFLSIVQSVCSGKEISKASLSNIKREVNMNENKFQRKLTIHERHNYPLGKGFPSFVECLTASGLKLKKFDNRLLGLKHLQHLDLSANSIEVLPRDLFLTTKLVTLNLSHNKISSIQLDSDFLYSSLLTSLISLDLSNNLLETLPLELYYLKNLQSLMLQENTLSFLPCGIEKLQRLRLIRLDKNSLLFLPQGFVRLKLEYADFTGNTFLSSSQAIFPQDGDSVKHLVDLCCEVIKNENCAYLVDLIPYSLFTELNVSCTCWKCGKWCGRDSIRILERLPLKSIVFGTLKSDSGSYPPHYCAYLCSLTCWRKWLKCQ